MSDGPFLCINRYTWLLGSIMQVNKCLHKLEKMSGGGTRTHIQHIKINCLDFMSHVMTRAGLIVNKINKNESKIKIVPKDKMKSREFFVFVTRSYLLEDPV